MPNNTNLFAASQLSVQQAHFTVSKASYACVGMRNDRRLQCAGFLWLQAETAQGAGLGRSESVHIRRHVGFAWLIRVFYCLWSCRVYVVIKQMEKIQQQQRP